MFESGLRFAFAFLPAGVAVVVGLVLAIQRRHVQPEVATPAIWGLGLQLAAIVAGALVNVIPSSVVESGGSPQTAVLAATIIGLVVVVLTVISWFLILTALFRRLPAAAGAGADAPTAAVPTPPPGFAPEPFADDAPTGRHALLDEHGQQVVAQAGVRLSPQTAGLAAGAVGVGAAGLGAAAGSGPFAVPSVPEHSADLPTEVVPVVGRDGTPGAGGPASAEGAGATARSEDASDVAPDPGPAGVDEAAVGGTPTGADPDGADAPSSPAEVARTEGAPSGGAARPAATTPDPGPAGVDEAAVGGTPTGADAPHETDGSATELTPTAGASSSVDGAAAVAAAGVDESAVGGTPTTPDADPGTPPTVGEPAAATPTGLGATPDSSPASGPQPAVRPTPQGAESSPASGPRPSASPVSGPQPVARPGEQSAAAAASGPQPVARPGEQPAPAASSAPRTAGASFAAAASPAPSPTSAPQPAVRPTPRPAPSPEPAPASPEPTPTSTGPQADGERPDPSSGRPTSHPGLAGAMRSPRPAPTPSGSDLFSPSAPIPEVTDEAVGGTPAEPREARTPRTRSSSTPVAGWFEPVTDDSADGHGLENRDN